MNNCRSVFVGALLVLAGGAAALAQPSAPLPTNNPAASANVRESQAYTAMLRSNPGFRRQREKIECGPIADAQLRASCIASFEAYAAPAKP